MEIQSVKQRQFGFLPTRRSNLYYQNQTGQTGNEVNTFLMMISKTAWKKCKMTQQPPLHRGFSHSSPLLLHLHNLFPRIPAGELTPPSADVLPGSEKLPSICCTHQVMGIRQMREISQRELIASQKPTLPKPLLVDVEYFSELLLVLLNHSWVLLDLHSRCERELENQN